MPHRARHILATLLITLHAVIAICGPGLHAGPGLSHARPTTPAPANRSDGSPELLQIAASSADHCPICDHFSQGQLPLDTDLAPLVAFVAPFEPITRRVDPSCPLLTSCRSRAPPRGIWLVKPITPEVRSAVPALA